MNGTRPLTLRPNSVMVLHRQIWAAQPVGGKPKVKRSCMKSLVMNPIVHQKRSNTVVTKPMDPAKKSEKMKERQNMLDEVGTLADASVGATCRLRYQECWNRLVAYTRLRVAASLQPKTVGHHLTSMLNHMFKEGESLSQGQYMVAATLFKLPFMRSPKQMLIPSARQAVGRLEEDRPSSIKASSALRSGGAFGQPRVRPQHDPGRSDDAGLLRVLPQARGARPPTQESAPVFLNRGKDEWCDAKGGGQVQSGTLRSSPSISASTRASRDFTRKLRSLESIQQRGRWKSQSSLRRYQKGGRLQQLLHQLHPEVLQRAVRAEEKLPEKLRGLRSIPLVHHQ